MASYILRDNRFGNRQDWIPLCQWHCGIRLFWSEFPFNIYVFSNYMYVMFTYLFFCYGFPLKRMRANNRFRVRVPQCHKDFRGLIGTTESNTAVSLTPRDLILWFQWHRWIRFRHLIETPEYFLQNVQVGSRGVIETVGSDPSVSLRPRDPIPRCYWDFGIQSRVLIETAESKLCKRLSRFSRRIRSDMHSG
jgi:hypothetical protein